MLSTSLYMTYPECRDIRCRDNECRLYCVFKLCCTLV